MPVNIPLGPESRVAQLFSYPNSRTVNWTLLETVQHWMGLTLIRDGLAQPGPTPLTTTGATATVTVTAKTDAVGNLTRSYNDYALVLDGPEEIQADLAKYPDRLTKFLNHGWDALTTAVPRVFADGRWDPSPDQQPPEYHPWRFFLPLGMALLNQRALLFFHYPPIRLLETNQDYLDDPVPVRCEQLLLANGMSPADVPFFNTVLDATPIGAEDAQGSKKAPDGMNKAFDPEWGPIPINYFHDYQKAMVETLLNVSPHNSKFTVPIVVYGAHPLATFKTLYGIDTLTTVAAASSAKQPETAVTVIEIIDGLKTPVIASDHPYKFYAIAQIGQNKDGQSITIGDGQLAEGQLGPASAQMTNDLVVMRWLKLMAEAPSQLPDEVLKQCLTYWSDPAQQEAIQQLVNYQGSLSYADPTTLTYRFTGTRPVYLGPDPSSGEPSMTTQSAPSDSKNGLQVIGDSGQPVDWWFMYKVSGNSDPGSQFDKNATVDQERLTAGNECVYFDSEMAKDPKATLVLAKHKIDDLNDPKLKTTDSPLMATMRQVLEAKAADRPLLGWFTYNDEDHEETRIKDGKKTHSGTGPGDRGHCKGCLAFDLETNTAFWLVHSVPLFPITTDLAYPSSGHMEAQTLLCIQLKDADTATDIAKLMYNAHGPNVNLSSDYLDNTRYANSPTPVGFKPKPAPGTINTKVPSQLDATDPRLLLMQDLNNSIKSNAPFPARIPTTSSVAEKIANAKQAIVDFTSRQGMAFKAVGKNKYWGKPTTKATKTQPPVDGRDFYNDLVTFALADTSIKNPNGVPLEVETWENTPEIPNEEENNDPDVLNEQQVDLSKIDPGIPFAWSESNDHAKLAVSNRKNPANQQGWVCVGDINFTDAQDVRGGGTIAFHCPQLCQALQTVLGDQKLPQSKDPKAKKPAKKTAKKAPVTKPTTKKALPKVATKKAAAKKAVVKKATTKAATTKTPAVKTATIKKSSAKRAALAKAITTKSLPKKAAAKKAGLKQSTQNASSKK